MGQSDYRTEGRGPRSGRFSGIGSSMIQLPERRSDRNYELAQSMLITTLQNAQYEGNVLGFCQRFSHRAKPFVVVGTIYNVNAASRHHALSLAQKQLAVGVICHSLNANPEESDTEIIIDLHRQSTFFEIGISGADQASVAKLSSYVRHDFGFGVVQETGSLNHLIVQVPVGWQP